MKLNIIVVFLSIISIPVCLAQESQTYINEKNGYTIKLPLSWNINNQFINDRVDVTALSPIEPGDQVRENVNTVAYNINSDSLDEFYKLAKASLTKSMEDWILVSEGELVTDDNATRILYLINTHPNSMSKKTMMDVVYFYYRPGKGIILTCTAVPETFSQYKSIFEQIALSFAWSND